MTLALLMALGTGAAQAQKFEGLAKTPQMGWNSWNKFACNVNEQLIRETADAMVSSGMKDAGYLYVNIDDCWHGERDAKGFIHPNAEHFPSGMKALSDYVHSKGLKLGIYSDAGWKTCGGRPGSRGYEFQDAQTYAEWGIDYLKYDWCDTQGLKAEGAYLTMREALRKAGRPMLFSHVRMGRQQALGLGEARRALLAHHRRHLGLLRLRRRSRHLAIPWCAADPRSCRTACACTPAPITGTTPTCWRSAMAA